MTMSLTAGASQATQIEQVRAAAEVAAAIRVAQDCPRDVDMALREFEKSCRRLGFAQRAFFRFGRGGQQVTGVTISFAQEAARCWQNMQSGMAELSRKPGSSEMVAFAWDVQMNTRRSTTFVNPHEGYSDSSPGRELKAHRDIYENNASTGSRREREMILAILPTWYVEMGKEWCLATLSGGEDGKPIETRRAEIVKTFEQIGVRRDQLVTKIGAPVDAWLDVDLATLIVIGKSIKAGETTAAAEFGQPSRPEQDAPAGPRVTAAEIIGNSATPTPAPAEAPSTDPPPDPAEPTDADVKKRERRMFALMNEAGVGSDRGRRLALIGFILGQPLTTTASLTHDQRGEVITEMEGWKSSGNLAETAAAVLDRPAAEQPGEQS
jgi:hypothetical protein